MDSRTDHFNIVFCLNNSFRFAIPFHFPLFFQFSRHFAAYLKAVLYLVTEKDNNSFPWLGIGPTVMADVRRNSTVPRQPPQYACRMFNYKTDSIYEIRDRFEKIIIVIKQLKLFPVVRTFISS